MKGIDVSRYQGKIDWAAVKAAGIEFAVIRAGYGRLTTQRDPYFDQNCRMAQAAGLKIGCYWFSYAPDAAAAVLEAEACRRVIAGKQFPLGVWFDQEYVAPVLAADNARRTAAVKTFVGSLEKAGFAAGLYCSADWLKNRLNTAELTDTNLWIAQYGPKCTSPLVPCLWQYTSDGRVNGISGRVDCDFLYAMPKTTSVQKPESASSVLPFAGNLAFGSRGSAVKQLQKLLEKLGFAPGDTDGIYGRKTRAAVRAFQKTAAIPADGIVGPVTRAALEAACQKR